MFIATLAGNFHIICSSARALSTVRYNQAFSYYTNIKRNLNYIRKGWFRIVNYSKKKDSLGIKNVFANMKSERFHCMDHSMKEIFCISFS